MPQYPGNQLSGGCGEGFEEASEGTGGGFSAGISFAAFQYRNSDTQVTAAAKIAVNISS